MMHSSNRRRKLFKIRHQQLKAPPALSSFPPALHCVASTPNNPPSLNNTVPSSAINIPRSLPNPGNFTTEQQLVEKVMLGHLNRNQQSRSRSRMSSPLAPVASRIKQLWAANTLKNNQLLWVRLNNYVMSTPRVQNYPLGAQMACFIMSQENTIASTKYSYAKSLRAIARRLAIQTPLLDVLISSLAATGALHPSDQATPATRQQVVFLIRHALQANSLILAVMIYLMYKTASRFDDLLHLTKESLIHHNPALNQIIIQWNQTKTTRSDPFRVSGWTVVQEDQYPEMLQHVLRLFNQQAAKTTFFQQVTYRAFLRFLKSFPETEMLTAHSFKRGAVGILFQLAADNVISPHLIPLLAKHKDQLHQFPSTTLRYAPNPVTTALVFGTQNATRHL